jgi:ubiquinol oxidase
MTWMRISKPKLWERALITLVQGGFYNAFFLLYLISPRTAHRVVGYLEEEAIVSYNSFIKGKIRYFIFLFVILLMMIFFLTYCLLLEIDNGNIENSKNVPDIAIDYWNLDKNTATLRDLVLAVRADEATHRDTNHHFADRILVGHEDLREDIKRIFEDHDKTKKMAGLTNEAAEKWKWNK